MGMFRTDIERAFRRINQVEAEAKDRADKLRLDHQDVRERFEFLCQHLGVSVERPPPPKPQPVPPKWVVKRVK